MQISDFSSRKEDITISPSSTHNIQFIRHVPTMMDDKDKEEELDSLEGRENSIANKINSYITTSKSSYGNNGKFKCNVCGKKGRSKETIQNHIKVNHMKQIATSQPVGSMSFVNLCRDGDLEGVRAALQSGADVNSKENKNLILTDGVEADKRRRTVLGLSQISIDDVRERLKEMMPPGTPVPSYKTVRR